MKIPKTLSESYRFKNDSVSKPMSYLGAKIKGEGEKDGERKDEEISNDEEAKKEEMKDEDIKDEESVNGLNRSGALLDETPNEESSSKNETEEVLSIF